MKRGIRFLSDQILCRDQECAASYFLVIIFVVSERWVSGSGWRFGILLAAMQSMGGNMSELRLWDGVPWFLSWNPRLDDYS